MFEQHYKKSIIWSTIYFIRIRIALDFVHISHSLSEFANRQAQVFLHLRF